MLDWWREAGVDIIVDEEPRDWLRPAKAPPPAPHPGSTLAALPQTLEELAAHLLDAEFSAIGPQRLVSAGDHASGLMLIADMPDPGDVEAGQIFSGETGYLFDRMLAAIGRDRASIYLTTIAPGRPAGRMDADTAARLQTLARHHVRLAQPRMLLVLGQQASAMLLGEPLAAARGRIHHLDLEGTAVAAVATFAPRYLLKQPAAKADAWKDLRLMLEELTR
ncbi:uracil-DNA glycosylase family protein [Flavisphingomonas formosensis]|uniref:uracil-DNA glycosylase family protein n=1 Tax=Flavisphingomonas formosensis TaxID=861534 RepID=UPI0012FA2960|nr:uracil-DNA glycosylase family protein [Sphingomonas formosensis]